MMQKVSEPKWHEILDWGNEILDLVSRSFLEHTQKISFTGPFWQTEMNRSNLNTHKFLIHPGKSGQDFYICWQFYTINV